MRSVSGPAQAAGAANSLNCSADQLLAELRKVIIENGKACGEIQKGFLA